MSGYELINLETFKRFLNINENTYDEFLRTILDISYGIVSKYTDRDFLYGEKTESYSTEDFIKINDSRWMVIVRGYPIDSTKPVYLYDEYGHDISDFVVRTTEDSIIVSIAPYDFFKVIYSAGYTSTSIPSDLSYAILAIGALVWNESKGTIGLKGVRLGTEELNIIEDNIPARAKVILDRYKRVGI